MYTKQEKLAAARKKLKEFQGKQRENDLSRIKPNCTYAVGNIQGQSSICKAEPCLSDSIYSGCNRNESQDSKEEELDYNIKGNEFLNPSDPSHYTLPGKELIQDDLADSTLSENSMNIFHVNEPPTEDSKPNKNIDSVQPNHFEQSQSVSDFFNSETIPVTPFESFINTESVCSKMKNESSALFQTEENGAKTVGSSKIGSIPRNGALVNINECDNLIGTNAHSNPNQNDISMKLANASSTFLPLSQFPDDRHNLSQILKTTEEFLKYKTVEVENMTENVSVLTSKVKELERNLSVAEESSEKLSILNNQLQKENADYKTILPELQKKLDSKEEQLAELLQKWNLKKTECEVLNQKLHHSEMELSSSLIKVQQLTVGELPGLGNKVTILQNENASLVQKIHELEKNLEVLQSENKQSSQHFHTYAQQCNEKLLSMSSEMKNLSAENQLLIEAKNALENNLRVLESHKNESQNLGDNSDMDNEIDKVKELNEEILNLQIQLQKKKEEIEELQKENGDKNNEIKSMEDILEQLRSENMKLFAEQDSCNNNQKLLAAMESDKIAAARAMSQNQKLKDQIIELEEGFIKMSHEKLQLTDMLEHEKHLNVQLEAQLKQLESKKLQEIGKSSESTTNVSADVEELKNIIRQLEEDKTELISRLNSHQSQKTSHKADECGVEEDNDDRKDAGEKLDNNDNSENSTFILQQMEEKVKKTMNEIAVLDEEKEKLEHLVLQLQGETETIGEYISLYQTQRMLMRKRNKEKDEQLLQLSKDKEELKSKLTTLNDLVHSLLNEKEGVERKENTGSSDDTHLISEEVNVSQDMAAKIQTLITEIQSTNLIDNQSVAFEHCPCCSGRLITI